MSRYRVVVTDQVFPDTETERRMLAEIDAELVVASGDNEAILEAAAEADALLNTYHPIGADDIARLERCRIIARYGIGVDNVDLAAARAAGITVTNVPDYCVEEVATHALALLLTLQRKVLLADQVTRRGGWGVGDVVPMYRLSELTTGLLGYGRIARHLAHMLRATGTSVIAHDPFVTDDPGDGTRMVGFDELLEQSHAISLHCPLTPSTRGIIGAKELARMRNDAVLVNTSRGPLVVLDDLLQALRDGEIAGAGLDVFEREPPSPADFEGVPGLVVTPHTAFYSEQAVQESQRKATTQVIKVLGGQQPDYPVN